LKTIPHLKGRLPTDSDGIPIGVVLGVVGEWSEKLALKLRSSDVAFRDTARLILEPEKKFDT
jgi:hypothetical protein